MKIACFDLETSNLHADFGIILCGVIKEPGKKETLVTSFPVVDKYLDFDSCRVIAQTLREKDIIVSWNGKRFDIPFLNGRLHYYNCEPLSNIKHVDLMYTARYKLGLHNARLETVAQHLLTHKKKTLDPRTWIMAMLGNKKAEEKLVERCKSDVLILEELLEVLKCHIKVIYA